MNYIDEIFTRADIQQVRSFLLHGTAECYIDPRPYKERIESAEKRMTARLREKYPKLEEYDEITGLLFAYVGEIESVYTEIGLQVGAILAAQVCQNRIDTYAKQCAE